MGEKLIDLISAVEETFGFAISDQDAGELNTVGKLYEYVLVHRFQGKKETRLSAIALYKVRRALTLVLGIPRKDLQPSTDLSAILPAHRWRAWRAMQQAAAIRLPQLRRPGWVTTSAVVMTLALAVAVPRLLGFGPFGGAGLAAILTAIVAGYGFSWLTIPLAIEFQPDCTTVGQLATATLARNYLAMVEESEKRISNAEVWKKLQVIVASQLGVRPRDIAKQTNFAHNLQAA